MPTDLIEYVLKSSRSLVESLSSSQVPTKSQIEPRLVCRGRSVTVREKKSQDGEEVELLPATDFCTNKILAGRGSKLESGEMLAAWG